MSRQNALFASGRHKTDPGRSFHPQHLFDRQGQGLALARKLAEGPADVMGLAKLLLLRSFETSYNEMMEFEGLGQVLAMSSAEFQEGLSALIDKRQPDYIGAALANGGSDGMPSSATDLD